MSTEQVSDRLEIRNKRGLTPLDLAIELGCCDVTERLLEQGAELDVDDGCWTTLHMAAQNGKTEVIMTILVQPGVDVDCKNENGETPLSMAADRDNIDAVKLFPCESRGMSGVHSMDAVYRLRSKGIFQSYTTPLLRAVSEGDVQMVKVLLTCENIEPSLSCDDSGNTVLHLCHAKASLMLPLLIDDGRFDLEARNEGGMTPFAFAAYQGYYDAVDVFLKSGKVKINTKDTFWGFTNLEWAVRGKKSSAKLVKRLLDTGRFEFAFERRWHREKPFAAARKKKDLYQEISDLLEAHYESQTQRKLAEEDVQP